MKKMCLLLVAFAVVFATKAQNVHLVQDLNTDGAENSGANPYNYTYFNEKFYFVPYESAMEYGTELWVYDFVNQPQLAFDIYPGTGSGNVSELKVMNNKLYFSADDGIHGKELWVYDGINQPQMVADINPNTGSCPTSLCFFNGKVYFKADNGTTGNELWCYDEINPPQPVADINITGSSSPSWMTVFNNKLYFGANDGVFGTELWSYDGTNPPTRITDLYAGSNSANVSEQIVFNDKLIFYAYNGSMSRLWQYDGTNNPTVIPGLTNFAQYPFVFNNYLYFAVSNNQLWRYDGTNNAENLFNLAPSGDFYIGSVAVFDNEFYFKKKDELGQIGLYKCDASHQLTLITNFESYQYAQFENITKIGNNVVFTGNDGIHGQEMYIYDLVSAPVMYDLFSRNYDANPEGLTLYNNKIYFYAYDGVETAIFYVNENGEVIKNTDFYNISPNYFTLFDNKLFFQGSAASEGNQLMYIDESGTVQMINSGLTNFSPQYLFVFNNKLYFCAENASYDKELYVYDGINSPSLIANINPTGSSSPQDFCNFNNVLYFKAYTQAEGEELWKYDGLNPPSLVIDLMPGAYGSNPYDLTVYNNKLYFSATDITNSKSDQYGRELYVYDGVNAPVVFDLFLGVGSSNPDEFTIFNGKLYFTANDGTHGNEIWVIDGNNPPEMIFDFYIGDEGLSPSYFSIIDNKMYFQGYSPNNGYETWIYDGVNAPFLYTEINQGFTDSYPFNFTYFNDMVYFSALHNQYGQELFNMCPYSAPVELTETACESYNFFGEIITSSGNYEHTEIGANGCDEITYLNLTIENPNYSIEQNAHIITVTADNASFQWLDCNNSYSPIVGETSNIFTATQNGTYAVEITQGTCVKISDCYNVTSLNVKNLSNDFSVYPNPTNGKIIVKCEKLKVKNVVITDITGKVIFSTDVESNLTEMDISELSKGIYFLKIETENQVFVEKIVKN